MFVKKYFLFCSFLIQTIFFRLVSQFNIQGSGVTRQCFFVKQRDRDQNKSI